MQETPRQLSESVIEKLISVEEKEIQIRAEELSLRKQSDNNNYTFAKQALATKIEDNKEQRKHELLHKKYNYIFSFTIIFILAILIGFALYMNKEYE